MVHPDNELMAAKDDETFKNLMKDYIKENFADLLGEDVKLLKLPNGLDMLADKYAFQKRFGRQAG